MNRGFTLIELLVVIAIIALLSSVVLANLNSARSKGADATVKSNLANMRSQASLWHLNNSVYTGMCADTSALGIKKGFDAAVAAGGNGGACLENAGTSWVAWAGLKLDPATAWCVDSNGVSRQITKAQGTGLVAASTCP